MKRQAFTWILFGMSTALLLGAVGWVTATVLRLESAQWEAAFVADREEKVRLALWRMESVLSALVIEESSRPALTYQSFHSADGSGARGVGMPRVGGSRVPSTLLGFVSSPVLIHFQMGPGERLTSPQAPTGEDRVLAESGYTTRERIETAAGHLNQLRQLLAAPAVAGRQGAAANNGELLRSEVHVPAAAAETLPQNGFMAAPFSNRQTFADNGFAQAHLNSGEFQARQQVSRLGQGGLRPEPNQVSPREIAGSPIRQGRLRPLWVGDSLVLARSAMLPEGPVVQGVWLDWAALRRSLVDTIADLLPQARLEPLRESESQQEPRSLASIPLRLVPADEILPSIPPGTPVRISLAVAWACVLAAALAVGLLLKGALALGERRGAFVSAVTHELRSPLTTFRMYSEMLAEGMVTDPDTRQGYLDTLCAESHRLGHMVENVLAFAGLERGSARRRDETLSLSDLVGRISPRLIQRTRQAGMELEVDAADPARGVVVKVDVSAVEQILFNLVDNACKYAVAVDGAAPAEGAVVRLEFGVTGRCGVLRLRDHGPGISRDRVRAIFRPFNKSAQDAARSAPGVGLGLALSRRLARSLGGDLVYEGTERGGASFALKLPSAEQGA